MHAICSPAPAKAVCSSRRTVVIASPKPAERDTFERPVATRTQAIAPTPTAAAPMLRIAREDRELVRLGHLQPGCETRFFPTRAAKPQGVVMYFHGYTAGAWQVGELQQELDRRGMHVYAPRLPGHGLQYGGKPYAGLLPGSCKAYQYREMAEAELQRAYALATAEGVPLFITGLSQGGNMAAYLAKRYPNKIAGITLMAPFLRPRQKKQQAWYRRVRPLHWLGLPQLLNWIGWSWGPRCDRPRPGHWKFPLGSLFAVVDFGASVLAMPERLRVPTQVILSEIDPCIDVEAVQELLSSSSAAHSTYTFEAAAKVPHSMLMPSENANDAARATISRVIGEFFSTGQGTNHGSPAPRPKVPAEQPLAPQ